jgi:hypothetical protein
MKRGPNMEKDYLFKDFNRNSPTTQKDIRVVEEQLEIKFPDDYIEFMLRSNGGEGQINERFLRLWEIEGIVEANGIEGYSILENAPGLVVIGSDGGGTAIGYDFRNKKPQLVEVDFIGLDIDNPFYSTENFFDYIEHLYNFRYIKD